MNKHQKEKFTQRFIRFWIAPWLWLWMRWKRRSKKKRNQSLAEQPSSTAVTFDILMIATTQVTLAYQALAYRCLRELPQLRFSLYLENNIATPEEVRLLFSPEISVSSNFAYQVAHPYDLILFSDHARSMFFDASIPQIYMAHGIYSGQFIQGNNYMYGETCLWPNGTPRYQKMFASSHEEKRSAVAVNPSLQKVVTVTGNLRAYTLLQRVNQREQIRKTMKIHPSDTALLIMSSWKEESLAQHHGIELLKRMELLPENYHFLVCIHPNNFTTSKTPETQQPRLFLKQVQQCKLCTIATGNQPWEDLLLAADMSITDDTSLALYFSLLHKPMAFVNLAQREMKQAKSLQSLYHNTPQLTPTLDNFEQVIKTLHQPISQEERQSINHTICDLNLNTPSLYREHVLELLGEDT